jgi:thiamine kinase
MPRDDLERLCRSVVPGAGPVEVQPLATGLISATYRVTRDGAAYALKTAADGAMNLGMDRGLAWEARLQDAAAGAGLAPPLVYADPARAVMLSRWMAGRPWAAADVRQPLPMRKIAALLRRVHSLTVPPSPRVMSPQVWVEVYEAALSRQDGYRLDEGLKRRAHTRLQELAALPAAAGAVCHSDLHRLNLLDDGGVLILLDWEYAHVSDPLWDVAGWAANNDFEAQPRHELLMSYLGGEPAAAEWARLELLMWLYDYVCLLWSGLYSRMRAVRADDFARRATVLDARLRVPAHYAAHADA